MSHLYLTGAAGLGSLADNGSVQFPTQTMAIQPLSQAFGTGNPATPTGLGITCATVDQRNFTRTVGTGTCDLGGV